MLGKVDDQLVSIIDEAGESEFSVISEGTNFYSLWDVQRSFFYVRIEYERGNVARTTEKLQVWIKKFEAFEKTLDTRLLAPKDQRAIALIKMRMRFLRLELCSNWTGYPFLWEYYCDEYDKILDYAETAMNIGRAGVQVVAAPQFYLHPGTVAILYGVFRNCREPRIRRRAISLIMSRQIQEGLWSTDIALKMSLRITLAEECAQQPGCKKGNPEKNRLHQVTTKLGPENEFMLGFKMDHGWVWEQGTTIACIDPDEKQETINLYRSVA